MSNLFTSESVTEGHPDKMADQISDAILDAYLADDCNARVAVETMLANNVVFVAGQAASTATVDIESVVRSTIRKTGHNADSLGFDPDSCEIRVVIDPQSPDIALGVDGSDLDSMGAGDQGMVFGAAFDETETLLPMPIWLAHRYAERLDSVRRAGIVEGLRPDGKTQVTFEYRRGRPTRLTTVLLSTQHAPDIDIDRDLRPALQEFVLRPVTPPEHADDEPTVLINPTGRFVSGGPMADTGLTGRKIIVDTYGGMARHGGGAFSGKDPTKVDRSGAYAARWIAKHVVACGAATRCEIQIAYAIGVAQPVGVFVETFGTATVDPRRIEDAIHMLFDLRPGSIIGELDLRRPIYAQTAVYGHFGRLDKDLPWEATPRLHELAVALGLNGPSQTSGRR